MDNLTNEQGLTQAGGAFLGPVAGGAIGAGTSLLGGLFDQLGQGSRNRASGRQAANMDPYIEMLTQMGQDIAGGGNYGGLRGQAQRELASGGTALNAQLASRGLFDSGVAMNQQRQLSGDVFSQLAQAINQDQLARSQIGLGANQAAAQLIGSTPGYQYFDRDTDRIVGGK